MSHPLDLSSALSLSTSCYEGHEKDLINSRKNNHPLDFDKILKIWQKLLPLTLPYVDAEGNKIQLWKIDHYEMIGSVLDKDDRLIIIPKHKIYHSIGSKKNDNLLERLEKVAIRQWDFVFDRNTQELILWPHLIAFGRFDKSKENRPIKEGAASPVAHLSADKLVEKLQAKGFVPRGPDPLNGKGDYYNVKTGVVYHIDPRKYNKRQEPNHVDVFREKSHPNYRAPDIFRDKWRFAYKPDSEGGNHKGSSNKQASTPATQNFKQVLDQTGLNKSYKANHPTHSDSSEAGESGEIGGVGGNVELIEGLFDTPESLFENEHLFFLPQLGKNEVPFTDQELQQILRELAIGIYVHDTVPFFSLHFNQDSQLYPVIHPAYEKTLVGEVFSRLDYILKGLLNGGVFGESFIQKWNAHPSMALTANDLIDFASYSQQHLSGEDQDYSSLRAELQIRHNSLLSERALQQKTLPESENKKVEDPSIFQDFTKFSNSFRIIAKQNKIQKADNLFVIDWDFDVFYTLNPDPDYKNALEQYRKVHGKDPIAYEALIQTYKIMCGRIHDYMTQFPLCRKYLSMLGVINFFCYYLTTLKKYHRVPLFPVVDLIPHGCPPLFPHLPLASYQREAFQFDKHCFVQEVIQTHTLEITDYFLKEKGSEAARILQEGIERILLENLVKYCSSSMRRHLQNQGVKFLRTLHHLNAERELLTEMKKAFKQKLEALQLVQSFSQLKHEQQRKVFLNFIYEFAAQFKNQSIDIVLTESLLHLPTENETSPDEIEYAKKIVGGCGMITQPQILQPSPQGESILKTAWLEISQAKYEHLIKIKGENPHEPSGVLFRLPFETVPLESENHYQWMDSLLVSPSENPSEYEDLEEIIDAFTNKQEKEFVKLLGKNPHLLKIQDRQRRSLLHLTATHPEMTYTKILLDKGCLPTRGDEKDYLPLHYAAMAGHVAQIKILLEADPKTMEAKSNQGATPLIVAAQHGHLEVCELLLKKQGRIDHRLNEGYNVLHCALHHGFEKIAVAILAHSASNSVIHVATQEGITPLMLACKLGLILSVETLLKRKADPKAKCKNGKVALDMAIARGDLKLCKLLLPVSDLSALAIEKTLKKGSLDLLILLSGDPKFLEYRNAVGDTPLLMAIRQANIPATLHILSLPKQDLNVENVVKESPLQLALAGGFFEVVEKLLAGGAKVEPKKFLKSLFQFGDSYKSFPVFIEKYVNDELNKFTPTDLQELLQDAAEAGKHKMIVKYLIPRKVNLNALKSSSGWKIEHYLAKSDGYILFGQHCLSNKKNILQPLEQEGNKTLAYIAGENGSECVLKFLLQEMKKEKISLERHFKDRHLFYSVLERAELKNVRLMIEVLPEARLVHQILDGQGTLPIILAAKMGSLEIVKYLVSLGASPDVEDHDGCSPLYYALRLQHLELIQWLLDQKSPSVSITAECLYVAAEQENEELLKLLIQAGAKIDEVSKKSKKTALWMALHKYQPQVLVCLLKHKASLTRKDDKGQTPLMWVCQQGQPQMLAPILKQTALDQTLTAGVNALHVACQHGQAACVNLLVKAGYSSNVLTEKREMPRQLAEDQPAVLAALGIQQAFYTDLVEALAQGIQSHALKPIQPYLKNLDLLINEQITISIQNKQLTGTLLQLLLTQCTTCENSDEWIETLLKHKKLKPDARDSQGNSYIHLFIQANKSLPLDFNLKFSLSAINHQGETPLHLAAASHHTQNLKILLEKVPPTALEACDSQGLTPIFYALRFRQEEHVALLAQHKANLEHRNHQLLFPLLVACELEDRSSMRTLLEYNAPINQRGTFEMHTALTRAMQAKNKDITLDLLFKGADCETLNSKGTSLIHYAVKNGQLPLVRFMVAKGVLMKNNLGNSLLHHAASAGHPKVLAFLKDTGFSLDAPFVDPKKTEGVTALQIATTQADPKTVKWLLEHKADPKPRTDNELSLLARATGNTPSHCKALLQLFQSYKWSSDVGHISLAIEKAIQQDYVDSVEMLYHSLQSFDKPLVNGWTGLHLACRAGALQTTQFLLKHGATPDCPNKEGKKPLELAAANSSVEQFRFFLDYLDPDLDQPYQGGETLLHIAVTARNLSHVLVLLDKGADWDIKDGQGLTPLHRAAEAGHLKIAQLLLACGADPSLRTMVKELLPLDMAQGEMKLLFENDETLRRTSRPGASLLHLAVRMEVRLAIRLLARHLDVNHKDDVGRTALHEAVLGGYLAGIHELLLQNADINSQDLEGKTPLWLACSDKTCNLAVVKYLVRAGADPFIHNQEGETLVSQIQHRKFPEKERVLALLKEKQAQEFPTDDLLSFNLQYSLTETQRRALKTLGNQEIRQIFTSRLLQTDYKESLKIAKLALEIISQCSATLQRDRFFKQVLSKQTSQTKKILKEVLHIARQGHIEAFLSFADTQKMDDQSRESLAEIAHLFYSALPHLNSSILQKLVPFNQGGKERLTQLCKAPSVSFEEFLKNQTYPHFVAFRANASVWLDQQSSQQAHSLEGYVHLLDKLKGSSSLNDEAKIEVTKLMLQICSSQPPKEQPQSSDIDEFLTLIHQLKEKWTEKTLFSLCQASHQLPSFENVIQALKLMVAAPLEAKSFQIMQELEQNYLSLQQLIHSLENKRVIVQKDMLNEQDDVKTRLERFRKDPTVTVPLAEKELILIDGQYQRIQEICKKHQHLEFSALVKLAHHMRHQVKIGPLTEEEILQLVAVGRLLIRLQYGIYLYNTQVLAILGVLAGGKRQAQVKTGEGKSMIIALWAFIMAMQGRAVDLITSSRYLARRDQSNFADFFKKCGISTSHICTDHPDPKMFRAQILYGPASDFEVAFMRDLLEGTKLYAERLKAPHLTRNFDCVCVDESDNLLIDAASNGARLAFPMKESYSWVYAPILTFVKKYFNSSTPLRVTDEMLIKLTDFLKQKTPKNEYLIYQLPHEQLKIWMQSAYIALFQRKEKDNYVIQETKDQQGHLRKSIQIIQHESGRRMENCRWSDGIHECLEVLHNIEVQQESLRPISLSHSVFYDFYEHLVAFTGTAERKETQAIYNIQSFDVPPHCVLKRVDRPPAVFKTNAEYFAEIIKQIKECGVNGRPMLVLCETIQETEELTLLLKKESLTFQLLNEIQDESEEGIILKAGDPGRITVTTNMAGRGTDILLNIESKAKGGLHVLYTFYPGSEREWEQGIGRAGRQGQQGSSQMVLSLERESIKKLLMLLLKISTHDKALYQIALELLEGTKNKKIVPENVIKGLKIARDYLISQQAEVHISRAKIERFCFSVTRPFFENFRQWCERVESKEFLVQHSQRLCTIKLLESVEIDFKHVSPEDRPLGEKLLKLLAPSSSAVNILPWTDVLRAAVEKVKQKILELWSVEFYQEMEKLVQSMQEKQGNFEEQKKEILTLYDHKRRAWEKYLIPQDLGVFVFLEELTTIDLSET